MGWLILLAVIVLIVAVLVWKLGLLGKEEVVFPYTRNQALFSPGERSFMGVLEQAIGPQYRIFGKVRVVDVVSVKSMTDRSTWQTAFNRISAKHFDFVICESADLNVVAVVELDDKSHDKRKRQQRDDFLYNVCQGVGLPLFRVRARGSYSVSDVRDQVMRLLIGVDESNSEVAAGSEPESFPVEAATSEHESAQVETVETIDAFDDVEMPMCPKCSAPMVRRKASRGANAGDEFWGCSNYPRCRGLLPVRVNA